MRAALLVLLLVAAASAANVDLVNQLDGVQDVADPQLLVQQAKTVDNPTISVLEGLGLGELGESAPSAASPELAIQPPKMEADPFDTWVDTTSGTSVSSGSHSVTVNDVDGSISIAVPVQIPNGAAGMQPQLALKYSSSGGSNHMGLGWTMMGFSSIHRCGRTKSQDGFNAPIEYVIEDGYCMDGSRLILVSGTYGKDGAEWRTETNQWMQILSHGNGNQGPDNWEVRTKEGLTRVYGTSSDSQIKAHNGVVRAWPMSKATDVSGNSIAISYSAVGSGEYLAKQMSVFSSGISSAHSTVTFGYSARHAISSELTDYFSFIGTDNNVSNSYMLTSIATATRSGTTNSAYNDVYSYYIKYEAYDPARSQNEALITSIQQCAKKSTSPSDCNTPYTFTWNTLNNGATAFLYKTNPTFSYSFNTLASYEPLEISRTKLADFNGDGIQDVFHYNGDYGSSAVSCDIWITEVDADRNVKGYTHVKGPVLPALSTVYDQAQSTIMRVQLFDWNNDGCSDVYIVNDQGKADTVYLFEWSSNTFKTMTGPTTGRVFSTNPPITTIDISRYKFADFNGDGFQDLFYVPGEMGDTNPGQCIVYLNQNNGKYTTVQSGITILVGATTSEASYDLSTIKFDDFNADSITDIYLITEGDSADILHLGTTSGVFSSSTLTGPATPISSILTQAQVDVDRVQFGDFNGDGYIDVYYVTGNGNAGNDKMWFFSGTEFIEKPGLSGKLYVGTYGTSASADLQSLKFIELSSDDATDIYQVVAGGQDHVFFSMKDGSFTQGDGANTVISATNQRSNDINRCLFGDLNGDGEADIYFIKSVPGSKVADQLMLGPNRKRLLTKVVNPLGLPTTLTYVPLTNPNVYTRGHSAVYPCIDIVSSRYVIYEVVRKGGDGSDQSAFYTYENAVNHQEGWGFLGFATVKGVQHRTGNQMVQTFSQDYSKHLQYKEIGKTIIASNGKHLMDETTTYSSTSEKHGTMTLYNILTTGKTTKKHDLTGTDMGTTTDTYSYDKYGNIIKANAVMTDSVGTHTTSEVDHTYYYGSDWDVSRMTNTHRVRYSNNDASYKSDITMTYSYTNKRLTSQCANSNVAADNKMGICADYVLDRFGNKVSTTISGTNRDKSALTKKVMSASYSKDAFGRYPDTTTSPVGLVDSVVYDYRCGLVTQSTSSIASSGSVSVQYNDFCMGIKQTFRSTSSNCATSTVSFKYCSSTSGCPSNAKFVVQTTSSSGSETFNYFNAQQQLVRTKTSAFQGGGDYVVSDMIYGANDEVAKVSVPYYEKSGNNHFFYYDYDVLDRVTKITYPNNAVQTTEYNGPTITTTNALHQKLTTVTNVLKEIISTTDADGNKLQFTYAPRGEILSARDPTGYTVKATYDGFGNRLTIVDGNSGTTTFTTDVFGNILTKKIATNHLIKYTYDAGGRPLTRSSPEGTTTYTYNSKTGKVISVITKDGSTVVNSETWTYDSLGRPITKETQIYSHKYSSSTTYDCQSRVTELKSPSGVSMKPTYNSLGHLTHVTDGTGKVLVQVMAKAATGSVTQLRLGGWLDIVRSFDVMGRIVSIKSTGTNGVKFQDLSYEWDYLNNLVYRKDNLQNLEENFSYDNLNRITKSVVTGGDTTTLTYYANGNIKTNSKMGTYTYGSSSAPHRVTQISGGPGGTRKYSYDAAGNVLSASASGKTTHVQYTSFNKPSVLNDGPTGKNYKWWYGSGLQIIRREYDSGDYTQYGDMWENEYKSGMNLYRDYLGSNVVVLTDAEHHDNTYYRAILRDHLGSVDKIVDLTGKSVIDQRSYSLSGKPRDPKTWSTSYTPPVSTNVTTAGYTNQADLERESLVHMGGRLYDSDIMRFYSADPYAPPVGNLQGLNKYSYVANRPMSDIDPTGYHHHGGGFWHKFGHWMLKITKWAVDAALLIVCEGPECAAAFNAAFNIVKDKIEGEGWAGSLLDGLCTFLSWEIAGEIGPEMDEEEQFERHVLVGLIQGVDSKAHGGSFASGFISGFNFNPYDNVFLKEGSAAGSVEWESKEELQEKLHHRVEKTIANQLGIPQPLVHAASELVMGDGSVGLPKFPTSLSKLPSLSIPSFPSIRPFDLIDSFPSLSGDISLSGLQSLSMSVANYLSVAIQQGPPEISAIVDVGFFRGTLPVDGIPEDLPFGLPGGTPFMGGYINVQFAPLGISVQADLSVSPGQASWGVFAGTNQWNAFVPVKQGGSGQMWGKGSPTSKQNNN